MEAVYIVIGLVMIAVLFKAVKKHRETALLKTVTDTSRGTRSELELIRLLLKMGFSAEDVFHDLYVEKRDGYFSQIDAVAVTSAGIVVFEVKDYCGWIFGSGYQNYWTQILAWGKEKNHFYNPVKQNCGHIKALKSRLGYAGNVPFYSVIVFYGDCELRNVHSIPDKTFIVFPQEVVRTLLYILKNCPPVKYKNMPKILEELRRAADNGGNPEIYTRHIDNVRRYYE